MDKLTVVKTELITDSPPIILAKFNTAFPHSFKVSFFKLFSLKMLNKAILKAILSDLNYRYEPNPKPYRFSFLFN